MDLSLHDHRHRYLIEIASRRDSRAAERFFRKILRVEGTLPRRVITDQLGSYGVAMKKLMPEGVS
jgi:putative transposase